MMTDAAQFRVERLRIRAAQIGHLPHPHPAEIFRYRRPHSWDALDRPGGLSYLSDHTDNSFPLGSVK